MLKSFTTLLLILFVAFCVNYLRILSEIDFAARQDLASIIQITNEQFDATEKFIINIGKEIVRKSPEFDLEKIHEVFLKIASEPQNPDIFSWTKFDWVDNEGHQVINTVIGVRRKNAPRMTDRNYRNRGNPNWEIIFSTSRIGNPSGAYVIPVGVQIGSDKISQAGTITLGIEIKKLQRIVARNLNKNIKFKFIDERDSVIVFGSDDIVWGVHSSADDKYFHEEKLSEESPYLVMVGYDKLDIYFEALKKSVIFTIALFIALRLIFFARIVYSKK